MGVHGLWRLIEPSGKPVPLETLENKILAVDVSIWLHQAIKGFQDAKGAPVPNAHLLGIYHRLCKLLYYRVKPVFVFDGGVPILKKQTIEKRNQLKVKNNSEADRLRRNLLSSLIKHSALSKVLSEKAKAALTEISPTKNYQHHDKNDDLYYLPDSEFFDSTISSSDYSDEESSTSSSSPNKYDLHSIDTNSAKFKLLPVDVRHEILTDLKETRKQSSWGRLHELPTQSNDFSSYQMERLRKRFSVQAALEEAEKEMGGCSLSLGDLEKLMKDQGVITSSNLMGNRIASDENKRYLLIKDIGKAVEEAKDKMEKLKKVDCEIMENECHSDENNKAKLEFEKDLKNAIALSLEDEASTSSKNQIVKKKITEMSFLQDFSHNTSSSSNEDDSISFDAKKLSIAQSYMLEYSPLTSNEIAKITSTDQKGSIVSSTTKNNTLSTANITCKQKTKEDLFFNENKKHNETGGRMYNINVLPENENQEKTELDSFISESDSNDEFFEVENEILDEMQESEQLEIVIKIDKALVEEDDDDLFKDVFEPVKEEAIVLKTNNCNKEKENNSNEFIKNKNGENSFKQVKVIKENKVEIIAEKRFQVQPKVEVETIYIGSNDNHENNHKKHLETNEKTNLEAVSENNLIVNGNDESNNKLQLLVGKEFRNSEKRITTQKTKLTVEEMNKMKADLEEESKQLFKERSNKERLATNITDQMYQEAQELLDLFGVPYIIAPMEAEAQCAFLDYINLTDGTITDDSDIWLFGGQTVYKNFFDQRKHVMEYKSESIKHHYKLTRDQMILLAMLVGSDYTTGLRGVGPVTALEILAAFPPKSQLISGLVEFKNWLRKETSTKSCPQLRNKLKNVDLNENFPNPQIAVAYLEPIVENSKEKFSWGKPDLIGLVEYARRKFNWTKKKSEDILNPLIKRLDDKKSQKKIRDYFRVDFNIVGNEIGEKMSKRVQEAVRRIDMGEIDEVVEEPKMKKQKTKLTKTKKELLPEEKKIQNNEKNSRKIVKKCEENDVEKSKEHLRKNNNNPKKKPSKNKKEDKDLDIDEELKILKEVKKRSKKREKAIESEASRVLCEASTSACKSTSELNFTHLHKKNIILQRQKDKSDMLRNKLRAIETFRKSKVGQVKKRAGKGKVPTSDASFLSEDSND